MSTSRKFKRRNQRNAGKSHRPSCPRCKLHRNPRRCLMIRRLDLGAWFCTRCGWQLPIARAVQPRRPMTAEEREQRQERYTKKVDTALAKALSKPPIRVVLDSDSDKP